MSDRLRSTTFSTPLWTIKSFSFCKRLTKGDSKFGAALIDDLSWCYWTLPTLCYHSGYLCSAPGGLIHLTDETFAKHLNLTEKIEQLEAQIVTIAKNFIKEKQEFFQKFEKEGNW